MANEVIGRLNEHNFHARAWIFNELGKGTVYTMQRDRVTCDDAFLPAANSLTYTQREAWLPFLDPFLQINGRGCWYQIIASFQVQVTSTFFRDNPGALFGILIDGQVDQDSIVGSVEFSQDVAYTRAPTLPTAGQENTIIYGHHSPGLMASAYSVCVRSLVYLDSTVDVRPGLFCPRNSGAILALTDPLEIGSREILAIEMRK
jgi:hypothetical protein